MDEMQQAKNTFIAECAELLQAMEDSLLQLETDPSDADAIGALFRAAHTIKGSSGLFGFDAVVSFTHVVENLLDEIRDGKIGVTGDLVALLLSCCDQIEQLVSFAAEDSAPDEDTLARGEKLLNGLHGYLGTQKKEKENVPAEQAPSVQAMGGGVVENDKWHISLRFNQDVFRNGMDPISFLRYLSTMGDITGISTISDAVPPASEMDPESCYLGFEVDLKSSADKAMIESAFEFVREGSIIHILPPHSKIMEYIETINSLPEDHIQLGELLVKSGAITQRELEEGLQIQRCPAKCDFAHCGYKDGGPEDKACLADPSLHCSYKQPLGEILVEQKIVQPEIVSGALGKQKAAKEHKANESKLIRVQAEKLDSLINLVGELVIAGAGAALLAQRSNDLLLQEATSTLSRLVEEIRGNALQLRMVQIGETFSRFNRVVRDVGREIGKEIDLIITGAETELDKTVVEKIGDPLMHLVRNSMDHGIENANLRAARGKPAKGKVQLNAYHDAGSIVIEVGDDGGGLNRDKILQKAIAKGIVNPGQNLTDKEIYNLIFEAGFSTAEAVTNLSGRGVGMDVVKKNIEALRGTVELDSVEGEGTTTRIRLPLTLAIIDGFLMGVGNSSFVVPLDMVLECVELSEAEKMESKGRNYINLRGEVLPFLRLREIFETKGEPRRRENIVVVQYGGTKAGLVVDELMGEFQTVIKPMGKLFANLKGIGGSTILGSGEVALILDVPSLLTKAVNTQDKRQALLQ